MTKHLLATLAIGALGVAIGTAAHAAQLGPYVGGSFGTTERDIGIEQFDAFFLEQFFPANGFIPQSHTSSLDTSDKGYAGVLGYRITAHLAVEGMFIDLGETTYRATTDGTIGGEPLTVDTTVIGEVSGIGLYALGIWPLSYRWEPYVRAGVQFTTPSLEGRVNNGFLDFNRESATDYVAGAGIAMSIFDIYGLRLEYLRVFDAGDDSTGEGDTDLLSLGVIVAF